jgi:hypothetical protein
MEIRLYRDPQPLGAAAEGFWQAAGKLAGQGR